MRVLVISLLAVSFLFPACQTPEQKKEKLKQAALKKKAKADLREPQDVDFQAFVVRLRKAVSRRDTETLKSMMTDDFGYKLEPAMSGPGVFQYWEQENLWPELDGILAEKFVKKGAFWVSPPQFADPSLNYDGYRAGITRLRGSWKFAYFVNG
jgi:hypothetical protein